MEPISLKDYGDWGAEMRELKRRLGLAAADEAGKFYDHTGTDSWYYYAYSDSETEAPENRVASRCLGRTVWGDVAVIRSGSTDSND